MCPRFLYFFLPAGGCRGGGKVETAFGFHFSTGHISVSFSRSSPQSRCSGSGGNVGISGRWRDSQGVVGRMGILLLDFDSFHTPAFPRLSRRRLHGLFFFRSIVRRKRNDSVPVSMM